MDKDFDPFRKPGSRYEHEEVIAVALIDIDAPIDWVDASRSPRSTVWIPESLFQELSMGNSLSSLDIYKQSRLDAAACKALLHELESLPETHLELTYAAWLVRDLAHVVAESSGKERLLVEGP